MTSPQDPTELSLWKPAHEFFRRINVAIGDLYEEHGVVGVSPRYSMALIKLAHRGPMTISELAERVEVTHSAMSQTVAAMRKDGLITSAPGPDARTRLVTLTDLGRSHVPLLEAEWRATEAVVADLEAEVPYPMLRVIADLESALAHRSFAERLRDHLGEHLAAGDR